MTYFIQVQTYIRYICITKYIVHIYVYCKERNCRLNIFYFFKQRILSLFFFFQDICQILSGVAHFLPKICIQRCYFCSLLFRFFFYTYIFVNFFKFWYLRSSFCIDIFLFLFMKLIIIIIHLIRIVVYLVGYFYLILSNI